MTYERRLYYRTRAPKRPLLRNRPSPYSGKVRFHSETRITAHRGTWANSVSPDSVLPVPLVHVPAVQIAPEYNEKHLQTHLLA